MTTYFGGVSAAGGLYDYPNDGNQFTNAADQLYNVIGSRSIKFFLTPNYQNEYPLQSSWSGTPTNLTELVQLTQFDDVITMGWTNVVMTTFTFANNPGGSITNWWMTDVSQSKLDAEYQEIYDLVVHLLTQYNNSGITFILQPIECDWNLQLPTYNPSAFGQREYIDWYSAFMGVRQKAVTDARKATAHTNVKVLNAIEPNRVIDAFAKPNNIRVVTDIAERVQFDIICYSAYSATIDTFGWTADYATWVATYTPLLKQSLRRLREAFPNCQIILSELGWPENEAPVGFDIEDMCTVIKDIAVEEGVYAIFYWCIFDNEGAAPPANRGYWLIKPDGTLSEAGTAFQSFGPSE